MIMLIIAIILATFLIVLGMRMMSRPEVILYFIATVVSIVALNIHLGFTVYASRIGLVLILIAIIVRGAIGVRSALNWHIDARFLILFASSLLVQAVSSIFAVSVVESFRQVFINASMMLTFLAVLVLGTNSSIIIKAVKYYLVFAVVQGLLGIYQVVGAINGLPMYQDLMVGIPVGNPRNLQGAFWFGSFMPRAFGFLSDTNHYAAYLVGAMLLSLAIITWNRKLSYAVLLMGGIGLILSLSRSAILTFVMVGLPVLIFLRSKFYLKVNWLKPVAVAIGFVFVLSLGMSLAGDRMVEEINDSVDILGVLQTRMSDFVDPDNAVGGSFGVHIMTRLLAIDAWLSSPILGVGMGLITDPWYSKKYDETWHGAHSHHLDALGQTGLLGASLEWLFMGLVGVTMWRGLKCSRRDSQERAVLVGLLAAFVSIILGNLLYHYYSK